MTPAFDFGALPPEINSGRMYSGPGAASMLTAALAWSELSTELRLQADTYESVVLRLTTQGWRGPTSISMAAAAALYVAWLYTTAAQAEQTASQANAAAAAYGAAFAMTVPPQVIATNRADLAALIARNLLGQNTPAIAATEAQYGEMWAQDAAAMYDYAGSSAAAALVTPFTAPQQNTKPSWLVAQAGAVTQAAGSNAQQALSQVISTVPATLHGMASPASSTASRLGAILGWLWREWGPNANIWNTIFSSGFYMPSNMLGAFACFLGSGAAQNAAGEALGEAAAVGPGVGMAGERGIVGGLGNLGGEVSGGFGKAAAIGPLSVPPSWTTAALPTAPLNSALGPTPFAAPSAVAAGVPGIAPASIASRGAPDTAIADTRFLVRPPMVPSWPAVG